MDVGNTRLGHLYMRGVAVVMTLLLAACSQSSEPVPKATSSTAAQQAAVVVDVAYAGDTQLLPATAKIFVFAREPGKRMPLAVESFQPHQLPQRVGFASPESAVERVEVVARLSLTGAVTRHGNDPEVVSAAVQFAQAPQMLELMIPEVAGGWSATASDKHGIAVAIELASDLDIPSSAKVFAVAQALDTGNPMPLAVRAFAPEELPLTTQLTDAHAMMSVHKLSMHDKVRVFARLSMNGAPTRKAGDWESQPVEVETHGGGEIALKIDQLVNP